MHSIILDCRRSVIMAAIRLRAHAEGGDNHILINIESLEADGMKISLGTHGIISASTR